MTHETQEPVDPANITVLVTGASGFVGLWCVRTLLERGYRVRGTVRDLARTDELRATLEKNGVDMDGDRLDFARADLSADDGWDDAVQGSRYVLHVASPLPSYVPEDEDELIVPARDGTLRVLGAAERAGVERVVMTSSVAAIVTGLACDGSQTYDESHWADVDKIQPYPKSKVLAERAAWSFVEALEGDDAMELVVINPGLILGPVMSSSVGTSAELITKLMKRELPGCPPLGWAPVDVRDVAEAHVAAMTAPEAAGKRFICAIEHAWVRDIARVLGDHLSERGYKIPQRRLPAFVVRIVALFDKSLRLVTDVLGKREDVSNERIKKVLGWQPRSFEEMVTSMADSLIEHGVA